MNGRCMKYNVQLSIIIPTYNRRELLSKCLENLSQQTIDPSLYEVIVVDDGSTDGTDKLVRSQRLPYPIRYFNQKNAGAGNARNRGIREAAAGIIAFIDDDILVTEQYVKEHLKTHQENSEQNIAVLGHIDLLPQDLKKPLMQYITGPTGELFNFSGINRHDNAGYHRFYTGNISIKKSFLEDRKIFFDPKLTACEDIEFGYRLSKEGLRIIYNSRARVYHDGCISLTEFVRREKKIGEQLVLLGKKHPELKSVTQYDDAEIRKTVSDYLSQEEKIINMVEDIEERIYPTLQSFSSGNNNLGDALKEGILNPLYRYIAKQARDAGGITGYDNEIKSVESRDIMVSIVIPVFDQLEYTIQCLEALASNTQYEPYEVIIIDNGSTDGTAEYLKQSLNGDVTIITNRENRGFAVANNQGAKIARGEYLVFLNNDTVPMKGWLENLVQTALSVSDAAVIGSKLLYPDNTVQHAGVVFDIDEGSTNIFHLYSGLDHNHRAVNYMREFNAVTAACMLVRKSVFFQVGLFDERYLNGYEDVDLCLKVRELGKRILYNPESVLYHYEATSLRGKEHNEITMKNEHQILKKWAGKIESDAEAKAAEDGFKMLRNSGNRVHYHPLQQCSTYQPQNSTDDVDNNISVK